MKVFLENEVIRKFFLNDQTIEKRELVLNLNEQIVLAWPSLMECLNLKDIFRLFPNFDASHVLFAKYIEVLNLSVDDAVIFSMFDNLFVECLTNVKALPEVDAGLLTERIKQFRQSDAFDLSRHLFAKELDRYENLLIYRTRTVMHDLVLYLAWDRMCVSLSHLFDYQSTNPNFQKGIVILKTCLIESFMHISRDGKTSPSFFRLIQALFYYYMREENLQQHTDSEWTGLCQGFNSFTHADELPDYFYIDEALVPELFSSSVDDPHTVFSLDALPQTKQRLSFADLMLKKLKQEESSWPYQLALSEVICLQSN